LKLLKNRRLKHEEACEADGRRLGGPVTEIKGEKSVVYELRCHEKDVGKVIGRSGKTVGAMRTLLGAIAARDGRRAMLEVVE
jgi:predicted RNA-binding protein YlqC (UPF0109 family)